MKQTRKYLIQALRSTNDPELQEMIKNVIDVCEELMVKRDLTEIG